MSQRQVGAKSQRESKSQKTSAKSNPGASSSSQRQYRLQFANSTQKAKYEELEEREVKGTLFYDPIACQVLGIDEGVRRLARQFGLGDFIDAAVPASSVTHDIHEEYLPSPPRTYRQLTLEFISSFRMSTEVHDDNSTTFGVRFRLFGQGHHLSGSEFNELFGWSTEARNIDFVGNTVDDYSEPLWWVTISQDGGEYHSNVSKASDIMHAALRYFHRMLVFMFFSRKDLGKTSSIENFLLWRAVRGYEVDLDEDQKLNLGFLLAKRFKEIREKKGMSGPIFIGGMVTWIAFRLGYGPQLPDLEPVSITTRLNLTHLAAMKMV